LSWTSEYIIDSHPGNVLQAHGLTRESVLLRRSGWAVWQTFLAGVWTSVWGKTSDLDRRLGQVLRTSALSRRRVCGSDWRPE